MKIKSSTSFKALLFFSFLSGLIIACAVIYGLFTL